MKAAFKFVGSIVRLLIYLMIIAGVGYAAVLWRVEIVAEASRLGVPEAILVTARDKLDQGADLIVAWTEKSDLKLPLPLPTTARTPIPGAALVAKSDGATPAPHTPAQASAAPARPVAPAVSVLAAPVEVKTVPTVLDLLGTVQAIASIPVKVRIDSQIESVSVKEGDKVKAGQVIFTLDGRSIQAQVQQAQAMIVKDQALVDQTKSELDRIAPLAATKVLSPKDLDKSKLDYSTAQAVMAADMASLENLKVLSSYYVIRSPVDGRVGSLPLKPGSSIRAADALLLATINQTTPVYVSFAVPQVSVPTLRSSLRTGDLPVIVSVPGVANQRLNGKVTFTENQLDAGSGTLTVKATVDNSDETLIPGQSVNVRVVLSVDDKAVTVPEAAVQIGQQGAYVFVVKSDDTVDLRQVSVDRKVDGRVVISSGVAPGDQVIIDGQARLTPNARVEIRRPAGTPGKPGADAVPPKQQTGS